MEQLLGVLVGALVEEVVKQRAVAEEEHMVPDTLDHSILYRSGSACNWSVIVDYGGGNSQLECDGWLSLTGVEMGSHLLDLRVNCRVEAVDNACLQDCSRNEPVDHFRDHQESGGYVAQQLSCIARCMAQKRTQFLTHHLLVIHEVGVCVLHCKALRSRPQANQAVCKVATVVWWVSSMDNLLRLHVHHRHKGGNLFVR